MNSRRRIATYGRVRRKINSVTESSAPYSPSEESGLNIWPDKQLPTQEEDLVAPENLLNSADPFGITSLGKDFKATRYTRATRGMPQDAERLPKESTCEGSSTLDIPPFQCEVFGKLKANRRVRKEKAGRECDLGAQQAAIARDEQSIQCHITTEARGDINLLEKLKAGSVIQNGRPSPQVLSPEKHRSQHPQHPSPISHCGELGLKASGPLESRPKIRKRLPIAESNRMQEVEELGTHICPVYHSKGDINTAERGINRKHEASSKCCALKRSGTKSPIPLGSVGDNAEKMSLSEGLIDLPGASTAHQRELWDMLLKGNGGRQTSRTPEPPSPLVAHQEESSQSSFVKQRERGSQGTSYHQRRKRRRLADRSNACENGEHDGVDALVDQGPGYEDTSGRDKIWGGSSVEDTLGNSFSRLSHSLITSDQTLDGGSPSKASTPPPAGRLKVTYARQRSFVIDDGLSESAILDVAASTEQPGLQLKRQSAERVIRSKVHEGGEAEECVNSQSNTLRSIYDLRRAGSNARAVSSMEALIDDIKGETGISIELKIAGLLDLVVKLQDNPYCRLLIGQGLDLRLLSCLDLENEPALKALVGAAMLHLLAPSNGLSKLHQTRDPRLSKLLIELLDQEENLKNLVKQTGFGTKRAEHKNFEIAWETLSKSAAWGAVRPYVLTARVIGLQCLHYLVRHPHESGQQVAAVPPHVVWSVARILNPEFSLSVRKPKLRIQLDMQLALSILEIYTIRNRSLIEESIWEGETLENIKSFLPRLGTWREEEIGTLRTLALRLYLNLMNNSPTLCKAFTTPEIVGAMLNIIVSNFQRLTQNKSGDSTLLLDSLILALGSMINLVEWCHDARQMVMSLRLEDASFLDILLQLYTSKQVEAREVSKL